MVETVVKGGAAGAGLVENYNLSAMQGYSDGSSLTLVHLCLCAEGVCAERCVVDLISDLDSFVKVGDRQNREEGTEALIAEQSIVDAVDLNNSGLDEEVFFVHGATNNDLAVAGVQHLLQALELLLVDDAAIVGRVAWAVGVKLLQGVLRLLNEGWDKLAINERAVLADADLAGVQGLRPQ